MALFSERRTNSGTFFLNHCSFIGNRLGGSDIPNELFDYFEAASAATNWLVTRFPAQRRGWGFTEGQHIRDVMAVARTPERGGI